ncbi:MAG: hypothetical protein KF889_01675 [Alphaproteobacteria bacterium]|nr:hypothetical protein [Alphaproteobacteria bacterium]MCW5741617.1 hypothetical protein [Alphaproteobacteria bacterium]
MSYEPSVIISEDDDSVLGFCACCGSGFQCGLASVGLQAPGLFGSWPDTVIIECPTCDREWEYVLETGERDGIGDGLDHNRD